MGTGGEFRQSKCQQWSPNQKTEHLQRQRLYWMHCGICLSDAFQNYSNDGLDPDVQQFSSQMVASRIPLPVLGQENFQKFFIFRILRTRTLQPAAIERMRSK